MTSSFILILIGTSISVADAPKAPPNSAPDPQAQLKKIDDEAKKAMGEAMKAVLVAKSDSDISKIKEQACSALAGLHHRAIELAAKYPTGPVAAKALIWVVAHRGPGSQTSEVAKALMVLRRDHARNGSLADLCDYLSQLDSPESEALLRGIAAENAVRAVQACALYNLAFLLHTRADASYNDRPAEAEGQFHEAEQTLGRVASAYGSEKIGGRTFAEQASAALDEFRRLSVGKPAPIIEGEDGDGKRFKLTDYQGKVVLLDFWAGW
jgi:hypothetical protein